MFNIEEGSAKHKEEVFQRRIKLLQRAYRDGFFNEDATTPMPEITSDGLLLEPVVGAALSAVNHMLVRAAPPDPRGNALTKEALDGALQMLDPRYCYPIESYCKSCCQWWMTKEYGLFCPECGGSPDPEAV